LCLHVQLGNMATYLFGQYANRPIYPLANCKFVTVNDPAEKALAFYHCLHQYFNNMLKDDYRYHDACRCILGGVERVLLTFDLIDTTVRFYALPGSPEARDIAAINEELDSYGSYDHDWTPQDLLEHFDTLRETLFCNHYGDLGPAHSFVFLDMVGVNSNIQTCIAPYCDCVHMLRPAKGSAAEKQGLKLLVVACNDPMKTKTHVSETWLITKSFGVGCNTFFANAWVLLSSRPTENIRRETLKNGVLKKG
jgi:hypothetical protein